MDGSDCIKPFMPIYFYVRGFLMFNHFVTCCITDTTLLSSFLKSPRFTDAQLQAGPAEKYCLREFSPSSLVISSIPSTKVLKRIFLHVEATVAIMKLFVNTLHSLTYSQYTWVLTLILKHPSSPPNSIHSHLVCMRTLL